MSDNESSSSSSSYVSPVSLAKKVLIKRFGPNWQKSCEAAEVESLLRRVSEDIEDGDLEEDLESLTDNWGTMEDVVCCSYCLGLYEAGDSEAGRRCDECLGVVCDSCADEHWHEEKEDEQLSEAMCGDCYEQRIKEDQEMERFKKEGFLAEVFRGKDKKRKNVRANSRATGEKAEKKKARA